MARKLRQIERLEFSADELTQIVVRMEKLATAGDGWINLIPKVTDDDERPTSLGFFTLFGGGGIDVTMCTWISGGRDHNERSRPSLGITHLTGERVTAKLHSRAVAIPKTWIVEQDHPRRGLVLRLPFEESQESVLVWALRAVQALRRPGPSKWWRAEVYLPLTR